eukprot:3182356-Pleurochrysis_carterae.AAC.1
MFQHSPTAYVDNFDVSTFRQLRFSLRCSYISTKRKLLSRLFTASSSFTSSRMPTAPVAAETLSFTQCDLVSGRADGLSSLAPNMSTPSPQYLQNSTEARFSASCAPLAPRIA